MKNPILRLFQITKPYLSSHYLDWLKNQTLLSQTLQRLHSNVLGHYLHDNFVFWLSTYANAREKQIKDYMTGRIEASVLCSDFIEYCFTHNIKLDKDKTLQSFEEHDRISDIAVKNELKRLAPKPRMNLLGFGLGTGYYERNIRQHLLDVGVAKQVKIYGFDPYAEPASDITFLSQKDLAQDNCPRFDIVTVRWVLHHIEIKHRWHDFISSINKCNNKSLVLMVEHGYLANRFPPEQEKLYKFLTSTFDIVANIGIRPGIFTSTIPPGKNFYVDYLNPADFTSISKGLSLKHSRAVYDVGPGFPNQTIYRLGIK
jgi:hypothetical protein